MKLFRRHRGSQTEALTPNFRMHTVPGGDPEQVARGMAEAFAPPPLRPRQRAKAEQPTMPGWVTSFRCGCGRGMYSCAVVAATENSKTIRMKTNGCDHTVDVTYEVVASGDVG